MRVPERRGHLGGDPERVVERKLPLAVEPGAKGLALHQRHHVIDEPVGSGIRGAGVIEREDVGVTERRGGLDLPEEPLGAERRAEFGPEDLDGDGAVVLEIAGEIDRGHPALAEFALDQVAAGEGGAEAVQVGHRGVGIGWASI